MESGARAQAAVSAGGQATRGVHVLICGWTPWGGGPRQGSRRGLGEQERPLRG